MVEELHFNYKSMSIVKVSEFNIQFLVIDICSMLLLYSGFT